MIYIFCKKAILKCKCYEKIKCSGISKLITETCNKCSNAITSKFVPKKSQLNFFFFFFLNRNFKKNQTQNYYKLK